MACPATPGRTLEPQERRGFKVRWVRQAVRRARWVPRDHKVPRDTQVAPGRVFRGSWVRLGALVQQALRGVTVLPDRWEPVGKWGLQVTVDCQGRRDCEGGPQVPPDQPGQSDHRSVLPERRVRLELRECLVSRELQALPALVCQALQERQECLDMQEPQVPRVLLEYQLGTPELRQRAPLGTPDLRQRAPLGTADLRQLAPLGTPDLRQRVLLVTPQRAPLAITAQRAPLAITARRGWPRQRAALQRSGARQTPLWEALQA